MRYAVVPLVAFLLALVPAALPASVNPASAKAGAGPAVPGMASSVFRVDGELGFPRAKLPVGERLPFHGTRVAIPEAFLSGSGPAQAGPGAGASWSRRNTAVAILASAILPGMGELYCYRASRDPWTLARVPVFLAVEGYLWYSYVDNQNTGKDYKHQYETYGDTHWSEDRFLQNHPWCQGVGGCPDWEYYNENAKNDYNYFYYTPIEADREEYYENMGKYNAFAFGWDDALDYADPDFAYWTGHRTYYVSLRNASDDYLLKADQSLMGLIVNRVVSVIDTGWLAYRLSKGQNPDKGWGIRFKTLNRTPTVVINRRF
jgi:hypothetical protein